MTNRHQILYSILQKNLNTLVSFFIKKNISAFFFLILINELFKTINSTYNMKSSKLKKNIHWTGL
jgi:hypothetical protein